jgi:hypothetical protein
MIRCVSIDCRVRRNNNHQTPRQSCQAASPSMPRSLTVRRAMAHRMVVTSLMGPIIYPAHPVDYADSASEIVVPDGRSGTVPRAPRHLSPRPKYAARQLCQTIPGWSAGRDIDNRGHSQLPGQPLDEQGAADAMVTTSRRFAAAGSMCGLQRCARIRLRQSIRANTQYGPAIATPGRLIPHILVSPQLRTWRIEESPDFLRLYPE